MVEYRMFEGDGAVSELRELCGRGLKGWFVNADNSEPFASRLGAVKSLYISEDGIASLDGGWDYQPGFTASIVESVRYNEDGSIDIWGPSMGGIHWTFHPKREKTS